MLGRLAGVLVCSVALALAGVSQRGAPPQGGGGAPGSGGGRPQRPGGGTPPGAGVGAGQRPQRPNPGQGGGGRPSRPQPTRPGPQPSRPGTRPPRPGGPGPGGPQPGGPGAGGGRPPGNGGGPQPGRPGNRPGGRPPQWGRPPQNRPSYQFRPNDRGALYRHYRSHLRYINRARRPLFSIGGYFPYGDIGYLSPLPPSLYGQLPPPPFGYQMGYFDGYVVVYDPLTYFIANLVDLLQ